MSKNAVQLSLILLGTLAAFVGLLGICMLRIQGSQTPPGTHQHQERAMTAVKLISTEFEVFGRVQGLSR